MVEPRQVAAKQNFSTLQAGRAIASLLVVFYHASTTIFQNPKFWPETVFGGFFGFGYTGVHFFFVLSGFIILAAHQADIGQPSRFGRYIWRRVSRVYPPYWAILIPIIAIYLTLPQISKPELTDRGVIANSFLLIGENSKSSLAVAWTLFHEMLFYLLFGLCILNRRAGFIVMGGWLIACAALGLAGFPVSYHLGVVNVLFAFGMAAFLLVSKREIPMPALVATFGVLAFLGVGVVEVATGWSSELLYGLCAASAIAGLAAWEKLTPVHVPTVLKLLGDASYSIYLVHYPAMSVIARVWLRMMPTMPSELVFAGIVLCAISAGVIFHLMIEKPLSARLRNLPQLRRERIA